MVCLTGAPLNCCCWAQDYDAEGEYIRTWCPELKNVPVPQLFEPWQMSKADQQRYGVQIGADYPNPLPASRMNRMSSGIVDPRQPPE